jgi:hypothetical protein
LLYEFPSAEGRVSTWFHLILLLTITTLPGLKNRPAGKQNPPATNLSVSRLAGASEARTRLGLTPEFDQVSGIEKLKIAVLDYGFDGVDGVRPYLPSSTVVVEHYDPQFIRRFKLGDPTYRNPCLPGNQHGRAMAQIVWAMTGSHPAGPKFYLLNANGPTMLRRAVRYAIESKVDIILFSDVFEGGGNGDGRGPIDQIVADATGAGIIWINAAGNYGKHVFSGPVQIDPDGWLRFRPGDGGTSLRFRNRVDENTITITLIWNDYRDEEDAGTDKDLDLYAEDWSGKQIGVGAKTQISGNRKAGQEETRNPRERIALTDLPANPDFNYRIRIKARKNLFSPQDRIRVLVTASKETYINPQSNLPEDAVRFWDASSKEEIFPPADHPSVVTVADTSEASSRGPTLDGRLKPDVLIEDSRAYFTDGEMSAGASNAAAYFAGIVAVLKATEPGLNRRHLIYLAQEGHGAAASPEITTPLTRQEIAKKAVSGATPYPDTWGSPGTGHFTSSPIIDANPHDSGPDLAGRPFNWPKGESLANLPKSATSASLPSQGAWQTPSRQRLKEVVASIP